MTFLPSHANHANRRPQQGPWLPTQQLAPISLLLVLLAVLLVFRPQTPDLMAQLARSAASKATGGGAWWTSWYGGVSTRSYSLLSPGLMNAVGTWTVGALSVVTIVFSSAVIIGHRAHARGALLLVGLGAVGNLASGRVTFGMGAAAACLAIACLRRHHPVSAIAFALLSIFASPLAGFFLGLVLLPLVVQSVHRRRALLCCVALGAAFTATEVLFPSTGYEPMVWWQLAISVLGTAMVLAIKPTRYFALFAALYGATAVLCYVFKSPIGGNILRLPLLLGPAAVLLECRRPLRSVVPVVTYFFGWLVVILLVDLSAANNSSAQSSFYKPLLAELPASGSAANRIEVIDPATHGPSLYVAPSVPLARGWERQIDAAQNELFYDKTLDSAQYRQWLDTMAVRWVALPNASLDYASKTEAKLVKSGLPYLQKVWHDSNWTLYQVQNYQPLASTPVSSVTVKANEILFSAADAGWSTFHVRWTRNLRITDQIGQSVGRVEQSGNDVRVYIPQAGSYSMGVS